MWDSFVTNVLEPVGGVIFMGIVMFLILTISIWLFPSPPNDSEKKNLKKYSIRSTAFLFEAIIVALLFVVSSGLLSFTLPLGLASMVLPALRIRAKHGRKQMGKVLDEREQILFWRAGYYAGFLLMMELILLPFLIEKYGITFAKNLDIGMPVFLYWFNYAMSSFVLFRTDEKGSFFGWGGKDQQDLNEKTGA